MVWGEGIKAVIEKQDFIEKAKGQDQRERRDRRNDKVGP